MNDLFDSIADMTQQMADLCRAKAPTLALCLELASRLARGKIA